MLDDVPADVTVFAVWEPIVEGQAPPSAAIVASLDDPRVQQWWDPAHVWSDAMREAEVKSPELPQAPWRTGETDEGLLYDVVAFFPERRRWRRSLPGPVWLVGGLEAHIPAVRERLGATR